MSANELSDLLETTARVLIRCFVFGVCFLLVWFAAYFVAHGLIEYQGQAWFGLSPHDLGVIHYSGMALVKCFLFLVFLFPYLAIRLVLRSRRCRGPMATAKLASGRQNDER